jgi:hypothetical protein
MQTYPGDGRTAGSAIILQVLVAQLIARSGQPEEILRSVADMPESMRESAHQKAGDSEAFVWINEIAEGMDDTITAVRGYVEEMRAHPRST